MLSSTMMSVIPNWSGHLRPSKRCVYPNELGKAAQENSVEGTTCLTDRKKSMQQHFQGTERHNSQEYWARDRSQVHNRNTVGWSTASGPPSIMLDPPLKRSVVQSVTLNVKSGQLDNRGGEEDVLKLADKARPFSQLSLNLNMHKRISKVSSQGGELSSSSSKPTTSGILLSLRKLNSNWRNTSSSPSSSETKALPEMYAANGKAVESPWTHQSPTILNENERERTKSSHYTFTNRRASERTGPDLSPSSPNHHGDFSNVNLFSESEVSPTPNPLQIKKTYPTFSYHSKQTFLINPLSPSEKSDMDKTVSPAKNVSPASPRPSQYERFVFLKNQTLPRRTTLRSTSWWKQVAQEQSIPLNNNNPNTPNSSKDEPQSVPRLNNGPFQRHTNNTGVQISTNKDNNNVAGPVQSANLNNFVMKKGPTNSLEHSFSQDSPDKSSDLGPRLHKLNLNETQPQKSHSLPGTVFKTKNISVAGQTTLGTNGRTHKNETKTPPIPFYTQAQIPANTSPNNCQSNYPEPTTSKTTLLSPRSFNFPSKSGTQNYRNNLNTLSSININQNKINHSVPSFKNTTPSPAVDNQRSVDIPSTTDIASTQITPTTKSMCGSEVKTNLTSIKRCTFPETTGLPNGRAGLPQTASVLTQRSPSSSAGSQMLSAVSSNPCTSLCGLTPHPEVTKTLKTTTTSQILDHDKMPVSVAQYPYTNTLSISEAMSPQFSPKLSNSRTFSTCSPPTSSPSTVSSTCSLSRTPTTPSPVLSSPPCPRALTHSTATFATSPTSLTIDRQLPQADFKLQEERAFTSKSDTSSKEQSSRLQPRKVGVSNIPQDSEVTSKSSDSGSGQQNQLTTNCPLTYSRLRTPSVFSLLRLGCTKGTVSPLSPSALKTSNTDASKGGNNPQSLSMTLDEAPRETKKYLGKCEESSAFDHEGVDSITSVLSKESAAECHSSAALSLPPDLGRSYAFRYSSPPYSKLKSARSNQMEATRTAFTSHLCPDSPSPPKSLPAENAARYLAPAPNKTLPDSETPPSPITRPEPLSAALHHRTKSWESSKSVAMDKDYSQSNNCQPRCQNRWNNQKSVQLSYTLVCDDEGETVIYRIPKARSTCQGDAMPNPLVHHIPDTEDALHTKVRGQHRQLIQSNEMVGNSDLHCHKSPDGLRSTLRLSPVFHSNGCDDRILRTTGVSRRQSDNTSERPLSPSPKKGLLSVWKRDSVDNIGSTYPHQPAPMSPYKTKSDCHKSTKVDQAIHRLRQRLSTKGLDDDLEFSLRQKPPSITTSFRASDMSNGSSNSTNILKEEEQKKIERSCVTLQEKDTCNTNRSKFKLSPTAENTFGDGRFFHFENITTEEVPSKDCSPETLQMHKGNKHKFDSLSDEKVEQKTVNQSPPQDIRTDWGQTCKRSQLELLPINSRASTANPSSPVSPFPSLSFSPADSADDSVFYSPKAQEQTRSTSFCKSDKGFNLTETGKMSVPTFDLGTSTCQEKVLPSSYSSCSDLKYGLEAVRSISVSSVMSSRLSGPRRISTGSRVPSACDLAMEPPSHFGPYGMGTGLDLWSQNGRRSVDDDKDGGKYNLFPYAGDPGQFRSRSLPRSFTRTLSTWSSKPTTQPQATAPIMTNQLWSPATLDDQCSMSDIERPSTLSPSPHWSPASRSSILSSSPGLPQRSMDYIPSQTASEESDSSEASSNTTTDDEYYLEEEDEREDRETEL